MKYLKLESHCKNKNNFFKIKKKFDKNYKRFKLKVFNWVSDLMLDIDEIFIK